MRIPAAHFLRTRPIAHRGLHGAKPFIPENSYAAFENAAAHGYAIETDVRLSADGVAFLFHDDDLGRLTEARGPADEKTWSELSSLTLKGSGERIPRFDEFLQRIGGRVPLLIELKPCARRKQLVRTVLAALRGYEGKYALQSFDPRIVHLVKKQAPAVPRGQLGCSYTKFTPQNFLVKHMWLHFWTHPDFISYNTCDLPYKRARRRGCLLLGWTVRTAEEYLRVKPYVDNVIFENIHPETLYVTCGQHR